MGIRNKSLTTSVDAVSGGAGNDTISGILGNTASFSVGDNIIGGAGTDTLNLIAAQHTANGLVSIDGVENVNVRLVGTAAETVELNAADWSGVAVLSNASSLSATTLEVSGVESTTNVTLYGNTDVSIQYAATTTGNAVATLVDAGTFAGATNIWASATANATANLDLDLADGGLVSGIAVTLSGNNYARLEGGANADVYTITGVGSAALVTDDTITSFDASGAAANIDVTFQGVSDVVVKGGAGNDTFRFGSTYSNADSVDGGAGTNSIALEQGSFNRNLNTTNVQSATITFKDSGTLSASASTVSTFNVSAGSAGVAASIADIRSDATVNLTNDNLGAVTLDYVSGAASTTINVGSGAWSADVGLSSLIVTDVASVTLNAVTGISAGATASIATASFDSDVKSILIQTLGGTGSLEIGGSGGSIGGATAITFNANGAANINFDPVIAGGATLTTLSVNTLGATGGSATLVGIGGTGINTINLYASGAGDITLGTVALGNGASGAGAVATINITQEGVEQDTTIGDISTTGGMALTINTTSKSSGSIVLNDMTLAQGSSTALAMSLTFGALAIATAASFEIDGIDLGGSGTGGQVNIGAITLASGASLDFGSASGIITSGSAYANIDVSNISIDLATNASAHFGVISTDLGAVGTTTVTVGEGASAVFGAVSASAIGAHTIVANGSGAVATFGAIVAQTGGSHSGGNVGAITVEGIDGAAVTFGTIGASSVGAITVSGNLDVTIGAITTTTLGTVSNTGQGVSGAFTIDLSGVTNAVEVKLGVATNTVISGVGNDVITLTAGRTGYAGNDNIQYTTATQGTDNIINFIGGAAASGGDQIEIDVSALGSASDGNMTLIVAGATVTLASQSAGTAFNYASNAEVMVLTTAYASTAAMIADLASGSGKATLTSATFVSGQELVIVWSDGSDSYISIGTNLSSGGTTMASGSLSVTDSTLAVLTGVTPGALVATNFDFV